MKYTSVYLRLLPSGKYQGILKYKDSLTKKWRQVTKTFGGNERKANRLLKEWHLEMERAAQEAPKKTAQQHKRKEERTVEKVVREFLDWQLKSGEIEASTYDHQVNYAEASIYPQIGHILFDELNERDISDWLAYLKSRYSDNTVISVYSIPRKVYRREYQDRKIADNPFDRLQPPTKGKPRNTHLDEAGIRKFMTCLPQCYAEGSGRYTALCIAFYTGMREGEVCGLTWDDVKFARKRLFVRKAIGRRLKTKDCYVKKPKNESSERSIRLNRQLSAVLRTRYNAVKDRYGKVEGDWFVVGDGTDFEKPHRLTSVTYKFARSYDIRDEEGNYLTFSSLRHTFATLLIGKSKADVKTAAAILGHANPNVTLRVYAETDEKAKDYEMEQVEKFLDVLEETEY